MNKRSKTNPICKIRLCKKAINGFIETHVNINSGLDIKFSPDGKYCAFASSDGYLRVMDWEKKK